MPGGFMSLFGQVQSCSPLFPHFLSHLLSPGFRFGVTVSVTKTRQHHYSQVLLVGWGGLSPVSDASRPPVLMTCCVQWRGPGALLSQVCLPAMLCACVCVTLAQEAGE